MAGGLHDRVALPFVAACLAGDIVGLRGLLARDAQAVVDGGDAVRRPVRGRAEVARYVTALLSGPPGVTLTAEQVNGRTGLVARRAGQAFAVVSLSVAGAEATTVWIALNPRKLAAWHRG